MKKGDKMAKISIIVPVYNVEKYIEKCLESIINQTFKDIEIIVVNDGTKDNSIKIIEEKFKDKRIKIYNKENGGLASARNYGIKKATSEYLFFVDSDDFIELNCLEKMYQKIIEEKTDLVICDYYKAYEDGTKEPIPIIPHYDKTNSKCSVTSMPGAVCKLIKTNIIKKYKIEFLENHYFEDNAIMPFACAVCKNFSYIQEPFYYYLQRNGSILNQSKYNPKWEDIFSSLDNLSKKFEKNKMYNEFYQELEYIYIEYLLHAANLKFIDYPEGHKNIKKVSQVIKEKFPKWRQNKYYKQERIKYKVMCNLFYYNQIKIINILRRSK